jgi:hypothetical protein
MKLDLTYFSNPESGQQSHLIVVMFQTNDDSSVVVGRPILAAAAFLRGVSRLKSRQRAECPPHNLPI